MHMEAMVEELAEAGALLNDELGEWWTALSAVYPHVELCSSEDFRLAYEHELRSEYRRLKDDFRLEEIAETQTVTRWELVPVEREG